MWLNILPSSTYNFCVQPHVIRLIKTVFIMEITSPQPSYWGNIQDWLDNGWAGEKRRWCLCSHTNSPTRELREMFKEAAIKEEKNEGFRKAAHSNDMESDTGLSCTSCFGINEYILVDKLPTTWDRIKPSYCTVTAWSTTSEILDWWRATVHNKYLLLI